MRSFLIAVLAVPLLAAAPPRGVVGLGVGAASSNEVVVKINGKNETVKLAGIKNGTYAGQAFLHCLVARRIVRVDRAAGRVTMLDGSSVADHLAEFLLSQTSSDPCTIGKAAYAPAMPPLASSVAVAPPKTAGAADAAPAKREGHVSFGSEGAKMDPEAVKVTIASPSAPAGQPQTYAVPPPAAPTNVPTIYRPPTPGTVQIQPGSTYTPASPGTTTPGSPGTVQVQPGSTYTPPQAGTTTIPSTSTNPP
ncbi:MAG TPA: hypothetical protein VJZ76_09680 [Thermoanaerobaculia bacterium]|nr:hypothetical protein [Thermoanaerobaculia bacterium]